MASATRFRSDETGSHVRTESPVDAPATDQDIEEYDRKRSAGAKKDVSEQAEKDDAQRHEKRPEGPYKDPADERKQGEVK